MRISIGLLFLWGLFYLSIRQLLLDNVRQRIFALRDQVFDFAADGGIAFDDLAYRGLRDNLNNLIRFANRLSAIRVIVALRVSLPEESAKQYEAWRQRVNQLNPVQRRVLLSAEHDASVALVRYVFQRSLFLYAVYLLMQLASLWISTVRRFYSELLPSLAAQLEVQAREEYKSAA
jgi:hypothetical protein